MVSPDCVLRVKSAFGRERPAYCWSSARDRVRAAMVQIAPEGTPIHSRAFEEAAVKPLAREGMLTSAKIMAMTTCDLLANPALVKEARREFEAAR